MHSIVINDRQKVTLWREKQMQREDETEGERDNETEGER
jgi:hypothetical protein